MANCLVLLKFSSGGIHILPVEPSESRWKYLDPSRNRVTVACCSATSQHSLWWLCIQANSSPQSARNVGGQMLSGRAGGRRDRGISGGGEGWGRRKNVGGNGHVQKHEHADKSNPFPFLPSLHVLVLCQQKCWLRNKESCGVMWASPKASEQKFTTAPPQQDAVWATWVCLHQLGEWGSMLVRLSCTFSIRQNRKYLYIYN